MSEVDRRRYTQVDGPCEMLEAWEGCDEVYYHESAVRELVKALRKIWEEEPNTEAELDELDTHAHDLLTHYAELVDNTGGNVV